jgi:hypothetical protein
VQITSKKAIVYRFNKELVDVLFSLSEPEKKIKLLANSRQNYLNQFIEKDVLV